jgi:WD40 repeat protein
MGVQVGEGNTQIIYTYNRLTWTDGVAPPPLVSVSGVVDSPYRGLSAFEEQDAAFFFGREAAATEVLERMSRLLPGAGLMVVSGVSGAGKSSLLRAGVLPRIRGAGLASAPGAAGWPCLVLTPGRAPLDELALRVAVLAGADAAAVRRGLDTDPAGFALTARQAAITPPPGTGRDQETPGTQRHQPQRRLLLVVDQFEQVFTQCADERQRQVFITALCAAGGAGLSIDHTSAALVVLGMRADFEGRCANYPQLAGAVQDRYLVTAMTERQLRMAITEPAKKAGSQVDDDLVEILLTDVRARQPGGLGAGVLPLLSHALDQAWRSRTGEALTLADYDRTGGIEGAVADSAQRAYDQLTPGQQAAARQVFTRLTAISTEGVDTADRATRVELTEGRGAADARDVEAVLEAFAAERLLTLAADSVEISHEILPAAWPLLRDTWLAETRADRIVRTRLHSVAADWERHARDPSYLYSGTLLQAATDTAARIGGDPARHSPLSRVERDFLHDSGGAHRRSVRRRQAFVAFLLVLVVGFASATALVIRANQQTANQRDQTARQRDIAISGQLISQSEAVGDTNPVMAKLLSLAAWHLNPSSQARYAMLAAAALPGITVLSGHTDAVKSVAFSPDGKTLASGSLDGTVRLWDVNTYQQIGGPLASHIGYVFSVAFSPDGKTLAAGGADGRVRLWDVGTHRQIGGPLAGHTGAVSSVAFSPDGKTLADGSDDGVRLWDVGTHRQIGGPLAGHTGAVSSVAFSPDGKILAVGSSGTVRLRDTRTGHQIGSFATPAGTGDTIQSVAFSPDGKTLAAAGFGPGPVWLLDVPAGRKIGSLTSPGVGTMIYSVAFSPDSKTLAGATSNGTVVLWGIATQQQIGAPLAGHTGVVASVAFSPDGNTLASAGEDHTVRLWDVATGHQIAALDTTNIAGSGSVVLSPDGKMLAAAGSRAVRLWDVATGHQIGAPLVGHTGNVLSVTFSPDGKTLAGGSDDHTVRLWDVASGHQIGAPLAGHTGDVVSVAFSPDGKTLASASYDHTVRLWDMAAHHQIGAPLAGHTSDVFSVAFSPDGQTLATGSLDGTVRLWDVNTHRQIRGQFAGHTGDVVSVTFSPDGKTLASAAGDGTVRLWKVATGHQITAPLTEPDGGVHSVAFSPDDKTLASGSLNGTVRLWDVATGHQISAPLTEPVGTIESVTFSPDGKTLTAATVGDTAQSWNVTYLTDTARYLCAATKRPLTRTEWAQYVQGPAYQKICP